MGSFMQLHKKDLERLCVEKSKQALLAAEENINNSHFETALNRIYYAIFYIVSALAYKYDFKTSKHAQLRGWFNKKFVYDEKLITPKLFETYDEAFWYRQKSDYDMFYVPDLKTSKSLLSEAKIFVDAVIKILNLG